MGKGLAEGRGERRDGQGRAVWCAGGVGGDAGTGVVCGTGVARGTRWGGRVERLKARVRPREKARRRTSLSLLLVHGWKGASCAV